MAASVMCVGSTAFAQSAVTFTPLGTFGGNLSYAQDVSADGSVVVGTVSGLPGNNNGVFHRTPNETLVHIATVLNAAVSPDGSTLVGTYLAPLLDEAFRWTPSDGVFEELGDFPGQSQAYDVSANGGVIVGSFDVGTGAFRWTRESGMVPILGAREARGITPDGSVIVGVSVGGEAFRWTAETGVVRLPGISSTSIAYEVSADGAVAVGVSNFSIGPIIMLREATRWTQQSGISLQSPLWTDSVALDVSADGSTIVGGGRKLLPALNRAFYWAPETGMLDFQELLLSLGVTNLDGWELQSASGISADGRTIVGAGQLNGRTQAWVATIPEPSTFVLAGIGGASLLCVYKPKRRQSRKL